eukprot:3866499-Amphidinium_carterae.1
MAFAFLQEVSFHREVTPFAGLMSNLLKAKSVAFAGSLLVNACLFVVGWCSKDLFQQPAQYAPEHFSLFSFAGLRLR